MKKNFRLHRGSVEGYASTMRGIWKITGGSYKYIVRLLSHAKKGSEYRYKDWNIEILRKSPNKDRGVDIN